MKVKKVLLIIIKVKDVLFVDNNSPCFKLDAPLRKIKHNDLIQLLITEHFIFYSTILQIGYFLNTFTIFSDYKYI